jgi:hypothetical protein
MMMSLFAIECARLASRGVGTGAKPALIEKRGREGKSGGSSLQGNRAKECVTNV